MAGEQRDKVGYKYIFEIYTKEVIMSNRAFWKWHYLHHKNFNGLLLNMYNFQTGVLSINCE